MKKLKMHFVRAVAGVMATVMMLCSLQNVTGVAAEVITDSGGTEAVQEETQPAETEVQAGDSENVDAFLTVGADLPETLTQDNYLPTTTSLGWLMDLYLKLS